MNPYPAIVLLLILILPTALSATASEETPSVTLKAGSHRTDGAGIRQVWVPAGSFTRGTATTENLSPPAWATRILLSEQPAHPVDITKGFWIDTFEVTNEAFDAFVKDGGYTRPDLWSQAGRAWLKEKGAENLPVTCVEKIPDHPRVCVTWYEAEAYAAWRGGRLPTEAEWEYAARGPESRIYPWGDTWDASRANVVDTAATTPVGHYPDGASWVGAHDLSGNAMEWVSDWLGLEYYQKKERTDPRGPATGRRKVEKGGWWGSNPFVARSAYHHFEDPPEYQDHHIGFRIVTDSE